MGTECLVRPGELYVFVARQIGKARAQRIRALLEEDREATSARIAALTRDFDDIVASTAAVATDDEHDPEGATIAFERSQVSSLIDTARHHLAELEDALVRLDGGDYGRCEQCGEPIAAERLAIRPAATSCVACASAPRR
jgi:RNA polymerase-binding transcription factor DksA